MGNVRSYVEQLRGYISGAVDLEALYEALLDAEYDADLSAEDRDALAEIRGVAMEVGDKTADVFELDSAIMSLLQMMTGSRLVGEGDVDMGSGMQRLWYIYAWEAGATTGQELVVAAVDSDKPAAATVDSTVTAGKPKDSQSLSLAA